jgi:hypothetical protein
MPTYGFSIIFFSDNYIGNFVPLGVKLLIIGITFVFTFILPVINTVILLKIGRISSLSMDHPGERTIPYASTSLYYFALFLLFHSEGFPEAFKILILGAGISIVIVLLINLRWKISAHMTGIGGIAGAALGLIYRLQLDLFFPLLIVIFVAGLVGFARLKLLSHSPAQVYSGFVLGFILELGLMIFYP